MREHHCLVALELFEVVHEVLALMDCNRDVGVQFGNSWGGDFSARFADVLWLKEELGRKIRNGDWCGVM